MKHTFPSTWHLSPPISCLLISTCFLLLMLCLHYLLFDNRKPACLFYLFCPVQGVQIKSFLLRNGACFVTICPGTLHSFQCFLTCSHNSNILILLLLLTHRICILQAQTEMLLKGFSQTCQSSSGATSLPRTGLTGWVLNHDTRLLDNLRAPQK